MEHNATVTETRERERGLEHAISRAFLTAHLATANIRQAESAVLEAIDSFDPDRDTEETLFQRAIHAAVQGRAASKHPDPAGSFVPVELRAVLDLSPNLRRCFVLRVLAGWSRQACGRLLRLNARRVDQYTCAALQRLANVDS